MFGNELVVVVDEEAAVEALGDLNTAAAVGARAWAAGNLDPAAGEGNGVVLGGDPGVVAGEAGVEIPRGRSPGWAGILGGPGKSLVVARDELGEAAERLLHRRGPFQAQDANESILNGAPEALDAALGLRAVGGDVADAEFAQHAAPLGGVALSRQFLLEAPVAVVADEDTGAVTVEGGREPVPCDEPLEKCRVAVEILVRAWK